LSSLLCIIIFVYLNVLHLYNIVRHYSAGPPNRRLSDNYIILCYAKVDFRRNRTRAAGKAQSNYYTSYYKRDSALTANKENIILIYIYGFISKRVGNIILLLYYVYLYGLYTTYSYDCRIILWKYITHTHDSSDSYR
jgi:hypothetical protein